MIYVLYLFLVENVNQVILVDLVKVVVIVDIVQIVQIVSWLFLGFNFCLGVVGDIKYFIFIFVQFVMENGDCWVLMDGRDIIGFKLEDDYGWDNVLDMSGLFICVQEFENGVDNDFNCIFSSVVGGYQFDEFKSYNYQQRYSKVFNREFDDNEWYILSGGSIGGVNIGNRGGVEICFRNCNFYVYICVD